MASIATLLEYYNQNHRHTSNKYLHYVGIPLMYGAIIAIFYSVKIGLYFQPDISINLGHIAITIFILYYIKVSYKLSVAFFLVSIVAIWLCYTIEEEGFNLLLIAIFLLPISLAIQLYGHKIEGNKPVFLSNLKYTLIGPAWLMTKIFRQIEMKL
jgi:uncharacterized membrane protein YGL010W